MFKRLAERVSSVSSSSSTSGSNRPSLFGSASAADRTSSASNSNHNSENDGDAHNEADRGSSPNTSAAAAAAAAQKAKAALQERINSESVHTAATLAATSMMGFMKRAQSAASVAVREGSIKAVQLKNKAIDAADMDALQRKLSHALDRTTGEVDLSLLNFSYITDTVIAMGFPSMNSGSNRLLLKDNPIDLVSMYMNDKHRGHYMIWNLSEESYDYAYFDNQVLEFNFPGHPAPPLGLLFKICSSIESWLEADEKNVAAVHCLTGKGRTGTVLACYLAWAGQFPNAIEGLEYVAEKRNSTVEKLTIPSQRRYIQYFTNIMDGVKPRSCALLLRRVIINTIPVFGTRRLVEKPEKPSQGESTGDGETQEQQTQSDQAEEEDEIVEEGCCPYLQIFKNGRLVFTTTWQDMEKGNGVQWASKSDGSIAFNINCLLQGDILVRCRHLTDAGERQSMFRAAFHTGYIPQGILRLTKVQLDGACQDSRFDQDFFVDFIFADVETGEMTPEMANDAAIGRTSPRSEGVALTEEDKQAYEDMLHRDQAFWTDIEARKERLQKQREEHQRKREAEAAAAVAAAIRLEQEQVNAAAALVNQMSTQDGSQQAKAPAKSKSTFSISGVDEDMQLTKTVLRKGSWNEEKDKELMSELESLTSGSLESAAKGMEEDDLLLHPELEEKTSPPGAPHSPSKKSISPPISNKSLTATTGSVDDPMVGLVKEFEDMKQLEKELGLESFSTELAKLPDGSKPHDDDLLLKNLNVGGANLDLLDEELKGLALSPKGKNGSINSSGSGGASSAVGTGDVMNFAADDFDELEQYLSGLTQK